MLGSPSIRTVASRQGANLLIATPEYAGKFIREDMSEWAKIVAETGANLQ